MVIIVSLLESRCERPQRPLNDQKTKIATGNRRAARSERELLSDGCKLVRWLRDGVYI